MAVERELFSVSDKILYMLLFILDRSGGRVEGKTKLMKMLFLLETEGRMRFDYPIRQYHYGPYRDNEYIYALSSGLLQEEREKILDYSCIDVMLTGPGAKKIKELENLFNERELDKAEEVIKKYADFSSTKLKEYVYKKYLDEFQEGDVERFQHAISDILPIAHRKLENAMKESERKTVHKQLKLVGYLEHIRKMLGDVAMKSVDKTERSVLLNAINELIELLKGRNFSMEDNPDSEEICDFIDNYADVHGIEKSLSSSNFSDFTEEEKRCIAEVLEAH